MFETWSPEPFARRDRVLAMGALITICAIAWIIVSLQNWGMEHMDNPLAALLMPSMTSWGMRDFFLLFTMWVVMMIAMMTPSAAPMILTFIWVSRQRNQPQYPLITTWIFLMGYLGVWTVFSFVASWVQWLLHLKTILTPMMVSSSPIFGSIVLLAAGLYQWSPIKNQCLAHCQSPLDFLMTSWREGRWGAFLMGCRHGLFCTGCCWVLMSLLFVTGVMNLFWIAMISLVVLAEKAMPRNLQLPKLFGLLMVGCSIFQLIPKH